MISIFGYTQHCTSVVANWFIYLEKKIFEIYIFFPPNIHKKWMSKTQLDSESFDSSLEKTLCDHNESYCSRQYISRALHRHFSFGVQETKFETIFSSVHQFKSFCFQQNSIAMSIYFAFSHCYGAIMDAALMLTGKIAMAFHWYKDPSGNFLRQKCHVRMIASFRAMEFEGNIHPQQLKKTYKMSKLHSY